jgi:hypothetical protein
MDLSKIRQISEVDTNRELNSNEITNSPKEKSEKDVKVNDIPEI